MQNRWRETRYVGGGARQGRNTGKGRQGEERKWERKCKTNEKTEGMREALRGQGLALQAGKRGREERRSRGRPQMIAALKHPV